MRINIAARDKARSTDKSGDRMWQTAGLRWLTLGALFLAALVPRGFQATFMTVDEVDHWFPRAHDFLSALIRGDFAATNLVGHPGVTTMWLVGLSDVAWCRARAGATADTSWVACAQRLAGEPLPALDAYVVPRCSRYTEGGTNVANSSSGPHRRPRIAHATPTIAVIPATHSAIACGVWTESVR